MTMNNQETGFQKRESWHDTSY